MSAHTHTRPHPAPRGGVDTRLPWWALALPTLAFVALLTWSSTPPTPTPPRVSPRSPTSSSVRSSS